ncbi:uncharacterized protein LOC110019807 isoform X2 [Phalaenopsis equestris]|uniref:uncharacterized protein LOC110019807 isoform X2 n=1 Tax=Phalaenopsis equestris TaxID=78828 RepID=UPI0009E63886|nr:uncharacterized protein LOC110019807 isoform X2 [Phalaenopsis equestris]
MIFSLKISARSSSSSTAAAGREKLKEKVEDFFGCEFELFIEFTGLISWCKGASIGWHSDDNRHYLKQRDFAAVCYLNSHGKDFEGGFFRFKDGDPSSVVPFAGDVLIYTADDRNVHSVDEVLDGERLTLTLWFTRNRVHDEDAKLISLLSQNLSNHVKEKPYSFLPSPASDNMYWFSDGTSGFDIRCARIQNLGFKFCSLKHQEFSTSDMAGNPSELLNTPVRLARGDEIFGEEFVNSLHALQVVQFYHLKASELISSRRKQVDGTESTESHLANKMNDTEVLVLLFDHQLAEKILGYMSSDEILSFSWVSLKLALTRWEEYMFSLYEELLMLIPHWVFHQTLFLAPTAEQSSCSQNSG